MTPSLVHIDKFHISETEKFEEFSSTTKTTEELFLKSVSVWANKPHVVNRRLCGSKLVTVIRANSQREVDQVLSTFESFYSSPADHTGQESSFQDLAQETAPFTVIVRELIPKSEFFPKLLEAVVYEKSQLTVTFLPLGQDCFSNKDVKETTELRYTIRLKHAVQDNSDQSHDCQIRLGWSCDLDESQVRRQVTSKWLRTVLLDRLVSWAQVSDLCTSATSLQLVCVDKYKDMYVHLKNKYGRQLVKDWTERTDPKKFVYEDVAIAAYLLLIWEQERKEKNSTRKQSFVDLGCGNGLLVYILTKEGYPGLGIDLKKRKIWETFGLGDVLKEEAISPSAQHLYPSYDWIIGNHSDELTPWIPVIAARSSYSTSFFLLPCCPHDFLGKFSSTGKGKSCYGSYMEYMKTVVEWCGFKPELDNLRIPSTKRTCLIGRKRTYERKDETDVNSKLQGFIEKRIHLTSHRTQAKNETSAGTETELSQAELSNPPVLGTNTLVQNTEGIKSSTCQSLIHESTLKVPDNVPIFEEITCLDTEGSAYPHTWMERSDSIGGDKRKSDALSSIDSGFGEEESQEEILTKRQKADNTESVERMEDSCHTQVSAQHNWVPGFKLRVDAGIRNCQRVPESIKSDIVEFVFRRVLAAPDSEAVPLAGGKTWKKGGKVSLNDLAGELDKSKMQKLKNECGGLQTLLRNHSHIFQVTTGQVQLRDFTAADPWLGCHTKKLKKRGNDQQNKRKTSLCWFDSHHPDGCPRAREECPFAHGKEDLQICLSEEKNWLKGGSVICVS